MGGCYWVVGTKTKEPAAGRTSGSTVSSGGTLSTDLEPLLLLARG